MKGRIEYTINAEISSLTEILDGIAILLEEQGFPFELISDVQLAADEAITNIILHGYEGREGTIHIIAKVTGGEVEISVEDMAPPFDPTSYISHLGTEEIPDRPPGGLGIILIRNVMDEVRYQYESGKNILTMIKWKPE
jgi:serine/threonine-protein kinase RsbW